MCLGVVRVHRGLRGETESRGLTGQDKDSELHPSGDGKPEHRFIFLHLLFKHGDDLVRVAFLKDIAWRNII